MGNFITYPKWDKITEEEYLKEKSKVEKMTEDKGFMETCLLWINFRENFTERPFYDGGILDRIEGRAKLLYTEYYKRNGSETYYLCGSKEYNYLKDKGCIN